MTDTTKLALLLFMPVVFGILIGVLMMTGGRKNRAVLPAMIGLFLLMLVPAFLYWQFKIEVPSWIYLLLAAVGFGFSWYQRRSARK